MAVSGKPKAALDASKKSDSTQKSTHSGGFSQKNDSKPKSTEVSKVSQNSSKPGSNGSGGSGGGKQIPTSIPNGSQTPSTSKNAEKMEKIDRNRDENLTNKKRSAAETKPDFHDEDRSVSSHKKLKKVKDEDDYGENSKSSAGFGDDFANPNRDSANSNRESGNSNRDSASSNRDSANLKRKKKTENSNSQNLKNDEKKIADMVTLQEKIMYCGDKKIQRKIVQIISNLPDSTKFKISESDKMLDFDLFALDQKTVDQLWACFKTD